MVTFKNTLAIPFCSLKTLRRISFEVIDQMVLPYITNCMIVGIRSDLGTNDLKVRSKPIHLASLLHKMSNDHQK